MDRRREREWGGGVARGNGAIVFVLLDAQEGEVGSEMVLDELIELVLWGRTVSGKYQIKKRQLID